MQIYLTTTSPEFSKLCSNSSECPDVGDTDSMQLFKEVHNYLLILVSLNIQILSHWNENWIQDKLHISYWMLSRTVHGSHYLWSDSSQLILFSLFPLQVTKINNMLMLYSAEYFCFATILFKVWCLESYLDIYYSTFICTHPVFIHLFKWKVMHFDNTVLHHSPWNTLNMALQVHE